MLCQPSLRRIAIAIISALITILVSDVPGHASDVPGHASDVPFYWNSIDVDIDVQQNGDMWVTETQEYVFIGDYKNERYRYIPLDKIDDIQDVTVTEKDQRLVATTGIENHQFWIRWQHSLKPPESHTFVLKYRVIGGLHVSHEMTKVFWKGIFADRKAPVQSGTVTVHLPNSLSGKVTSYITQGVPATSQRIDDQTFKFLSDRALQPGEELEIQISVPSGILQLSQLRWQTLSIKEIFQFISQNFFTVLFGLIFGGIILAMPIGMLRTRRCPQCRKLSLRTRSQTLVEPTPHHSGKAWITQHCNACSYHQEFERTIIYYADHSSYSGGGGGGGGGDSGGGGGGGG